MAISTYSELKTAVANWLDRDDLTLRIPEFITIAEADINRLPRIRAMEQRVTATLDEEYISLPTDFLSMRNFQLNTNPKQVLRFVTPEYIDTFWAGSLTGRPVVYTMLGGEIQVAPSPDSSYTAEMDYYKRWNIATDVVNWLLTNNPDVYLYGTLLQAEPFLRNDKRLKIWGGMYQKALADLELSDWRERFSGGSLAMRADISPV